MQCILHIFENSASDVYVALQGLLKSTDHTAGIDSPIARVLLHLRNGTQDKCMCYLNVRRLELGDLGDNLLETFPEGKLHTESIYNV